ncbi:MAG: STAS domain-containing protein [Phycisphaerae bacterium]|nr:STAS domain-containing protein [Phycisphaerae bacterium]
MTLSADRPLQLDVRQDERGFIVSVHGSVDVLDAPALQDQLEQLIPLPSPLVVLDLSDLDFIGPDGIDALLTARQALQSHHGEIRLVHPNPEIRRVLQVTRLTEILPIFDTVEQAME